jgi:hypothetical protein
LGRFHISAIVNSAAINIPVQKSLNIPISLYLDKQNSSSGLAESHDSSISGFLDTTNHFPE